MKTKVVIAGQTFEFTEKALTDFNAFLMREDVVPMREKYNSATEGYDYIPCEKRLQLQTKQVTEWK